MDGTENNDSKSLLSKITSYITFSGNSNNSQKQKSDTSQPKSFFSSSSNQAFGNEFGESYYSSTKPNGNSQVTTPKSATPVTKKGSDDHIQRKNSTSLSTSSLQTSPSLHASDNSHKSTPRKHQNSNASINNSSASSSTASMTSPLESSMKPVTNFMGDGEEVHQTRNSSKKQSALFDDSEYITHSKLEKFDELLLQNEDPDLDKIKKLSWSGIPTQHRALAWKLVLGYLPCSISLREQTLKRKRKEYLELVSKYYDEKAMKKTEYEIGIQRQIHIDVPRTNPDVPLFQVQAIQDALERILYVWSIRHPASGYVQGINDIVTPFMTVFLYDSIGGDVLSLRDVSDIDEETFSNVECDSFWCFSLFLDFIQDHYTFSQPGIRRMVQKLEEIIQKIDEPLYKHIQEHNLNFMQFAFRWMNCLLMRELSLRLIVRMFDAFLSEGEYFESLHVYVCASFLNTWSEKLRKSDFTEMVIFLQHLPTHDWTYKEIEMLLSQAYMLKTLYDHTNHF